MGKGLEQFCGQIECSFFQTSLEDGLSPGSPKAPSVNHRLIQESDNFGFDPRPATTTHPTQPWASLFPCTPYLLCLRRRWSSFTGFCEEPSLHCFPGLLWRGAYPIHSSSSELRTQTVVRGLREKGGASMQSSHRLFPLFPSFSIHFP